MGQGADWWFIAVNFGPFVLMVALAIWILWQTTKRTALIRTANASHMAEMQHQTALLEQINMKLGPR